MRTSEGNRKQSQQEADTEGRRKQFVSILTNV